MILRVIVDTLKVTLVGNFHLTLGRGHCKIKRSSPLFRATFHLEYLSQRAESYDTTANNSEGHNLH